MVIATDVTACLQCGGEGRLVYSELRDRFFRVPGQWSVLSCERCRLLWLNPRPVPSEIQKLYSDYYTHVAGRGESAIQRLHRAIKQAILASRFGYANCRPESGFRNLLGAVVGVLPTVRRRVEREVLYLTGERRGRLLDVGSGDGSFMAQMRKLGWTVFGVEPDPKAAHVSTDELGCRVQLGTIHDITFQQGFFDAITLCHVIEHVPDPVAVLHRCNLLLKTNGTLVVATPNAAALGHRLLKESWRELDPPRHFCVFDPGTLRRCVERAGFDVERVVSSSRNASQIWSTSRQIQQTGRMNPEAIALSLRIEGFLFRRVEALVQACTKSAVSEEITIVATKA
jgi:2-polyprenyl-3-methyl-5-hydroxy-6-metoxy-1,4-benzoquinol methylase